DPASVRLSQIGSRQDFDTASFPNGFRGRFTSTKFSKIEPKKEASGWAIISGHGAKLFRSGCKLFAIELAAQFDMSLVGPKRGRGILDWQRHLRRSHIAVFRVVLEKRRVACDEPGTQSRCIRPLGK